MDLGFATDQNRVTRLRLSFEEIATIAVDEDRQRADEFITERVRAGELHCWPTARSLCDALASVAFGSIEPPAERRTGVKREAAAFQALFQHHADGL